MLNEAGSDLLPNWLVSHSGASPGLVETCKTSKAGDGVGGVDTAPAADSSLAPTPPWLPRAGSPLLKSVHIGNMERPWRTGRDLSQYRPVQGAQRWSRLSPSFEVLWLMRQRATRGTQDRLRVEPGQRRVRASPPMPNEGVDLKGGTKHSPYSFSFNPLNNL